jgi:hypothetical protein
MYNLVGILVNITAKLPSILVGVVASTTLEDFGGLPLFLVVGGGNSLGADAVGGAIDVAAVAGTETFVGSATSFVVAVVVSFWFFLRLALVRANPIFLFFVMICNKPYIFSYDICHEP